MDRGEVTTLTLLDLSAPFDNKPEFLTDLLGRNAQNVYTPQIQIDMFTMKLRLGEELSP